MNVKRFSGRSSRDALNLVRQAFGDDAVVLSTRPCADGVEVLAMAAASVPPAERAAPRAVAAPPRPAAHADAPLHTAEPTSVEHDVAQLSMSTLSFQDYVRERMLRRRRAEQQAQAQAQATAAQAEARAAQRLAQPEPPAAGLLRLRARSGSGDAARPSAPLLRDALVEPAALPAAPAASAAAAQAASAAAAPAARASARKWCASKCSPFNATNRSPGCRLRVSLCTRSKPTAPSPTSVLPGSSAWAWASVSIMRVLRLRLAHAATAPRAPRRRRRTRA